MPFTSIVVNTPLELDAKKQLAAAVTKLFTDKMKVCASLGHLHPGCLQSLVWVGFDQLALLLRRQTVINKYAYMHVPTTCDTGYASTEPGSAVNANERA